MSINQFMGLVAQYTNSIGLKIPDRPRQMMAPSIATIRDISVDLTGSRINIRYTKAAYTVDLNVVGGLNVVLYSLANNSFTMNDDPIPKIPFNSQLSINNNRYCYVIFRITNENLQFTRDRDPFSLSLEAFYPQVYYEPRRVDSQGATVAPGVVCGGCKVAYLIADGPAAAGSYVDPFNLHLDLLDKDSDGNDSVIPVTVDPDVRYPGGSGP